MTEAEDHSKLLWDARESLNMFADMVEGSTGRIADRERDLIRQIDEFRTANGWNPNGFGGEGTPLNKMQRDVRYFHNINGIPTPTEPRPIPEDLKELRVKLIKEELEEFIEGLDANNIVMQYDALIDILYVTLGAIDLMGLNAQPGFDEVQLSNMSKLGIDGLPIISRGEELDGFPEGKILKGPNYFKPNLTLVVQEQGWVPVPADGDV